jgi:hypothetical protein
MKRLLWLIAVLVPFIAINTQLSKAVEVYAGDTKVNLAAPDGYCPLEKEHPMDGQALNVMQQAIQGRNEELALFVPCGRLKAWREGKAEGFGDNTADYQILLDAKSKRFSPQQVIPSVCSEFRKQGVKLSKNAVEEFNKNLDSIELFAKNVKVNSQEMYGVLHEDRTGCYVGFVQKTAVYDRIETWFTVHAVTVVKGKAIYFFYNDKFENPEVIQRILATTRSTVEATLAQN